jgi:hypothetical protein
MDGEDGSTIFKDESDSQHVVTANDNAQIDTAQSVFGGASAFFDGSGDYLSIPDSSDWDISSGMFSIDFRVRWTSQTSTDGLLHNHNGAPNGGWEIIYNGTKLLFNYSSSGTITQYAWTPSLNTWYHIAVTFDGTTDRMFLDGAQVHSVTRGTGPVFESGGLAIGERYGTSDPFHGHIDELRIVKGVTTWTSNFTPPTAPYDCPNESSSSSSSSSEQYSSSSSSEQYSSSSSSEQYSSSSSSEQYSSSSSSEQYSSSSSSSSLGYSSSSSSSSSSEAAVTLGNGGSIDVDAISGVGDYGHVQITYTGGTTPPSADATVIVNGVSYKIANVAGDFVWDHDNGQGGLHTFTFVGESIDRNAAGFDFSVVYDGTGSLIFTVYLNVNHSSSSSSSEQFSSSSSSSSGGYSSSSSSSSEGYSSSSSSSSEGYSSSSSSSERYSSSSESIGNFSSSSSSEQYSSSSSSIDSSSSSSSSSEGYSSSSSSSSEGYSSSSSSSEGYSESSSSEGDIDYGLVEHWTMDSTTANSISSNNLTLQNEATWDTSNFVIGSASLDLTDGTGGVDYATMDSAITLGGNDPSAISLWFRGQTNGILVGGDFINYIYRQGSSTIQVRRNGTLVHFIVPSMNTTNWYHLVVNFVKSGAQTKAEVWLDGVKSVTSPAASSSLLVVDRFGVYISESIPLVGHLDDVRVYNRSLSNSEIFNLSIPSRQSSSSSSSVDSSSSSSIDSSSSTSSEMHSSSSSSEGRSSSSSSSIDSSSTSSGPWPLEKVNCTSNTDPRVKMTICWTTTSEATFDFLGESNSWESWTNGESKILCPTSYNTSGREDWLFFFNPPVTGSAARIRLRGKIAESYNVNVQKDVYGTGDDFRLTQSKGQYTTVSNKTDNLTTPKYGNNASVFAVQNWVDAKKFHYLTASTSTHGNVTIKWEPIAGQPSGTETWADWSNVFSTLNSYYALTTGNEGCP